MLSSVNQQGINLQGHNLVNAYEVKAGMVC